MASLDITEAVIAFSESRPEVQRFREIDQLFNVRTTRVGTNNRVQEFVERTILLEKDKVRLRQERDQLAIINAVALKEQFPNAFNVKTVEVSREFFNHLVRKSWTERYLRVDPTVLTALHQIVKDQGLQTHDLLVLTTPSETRRHHIFVNIRGLTGCTTDDSRMYSATTRAFWRFRGISPDILYRLSLKRLE